MSFQSVVAGLPSPVKELVLKATNDGADASLLGESEADQKSVSGWIEKTAKGEIGKGGDLESLNEILVPKTYLATNYLTAADVALYGVLHPVFSNIKSASELTHPSVTRYFDHIQSKPIVRKSADALQQFGPIPIDVDNAPKVERKVEPVKRKEKAPKPEQATETAVPTEKKGKGKKEAASTDSAPAERAQKKEKVKKEGNEEGGSKKKEKQKAPAAPAAPAADDGPPVPSMIDLRVGHIVDVIKHPDADGLYVEQIDLGEETGPRTVVSGLVNYIPIENMRDKYLVAICNLKPASMRGVKSFAMVLCATSKEGKEGGIELIQPPPGSKPGERVYFEGAEYESKTPLPQLNPKKKIFEAIQPGFITLDTKEAAWINPETGSVHKIRTKDGVCLAPTLVGASLS
ncbi:nucleic acid-binding protein [Coprinopsis marcescibilis]|uniref:Nucleic acid-binding protein n=1 Tax=Coprinopsis marcescibilis TaxID=230819 RepID=A0A5C3L5S9_COPMA|nr:nucleic acid-binding protein [Coprinopsis marcescibilis]